MDCTILLVLETQYALAEGKIKKGKLLLSHRYNPLPLLRSHPGGVQEELVVKDLPRHKDRQKVDIG